MSLVNWPVSKCPFVLLFDRSVFDHSVNTLEIILCEENDIDHFDCYKQVVGCCMDSLGSDVKWPVISMLVESLLWLCISVQQGSIFFLKISLKMSWFQFLSCKAKCISIWLGKWRIFLLWVGMLHSTQFCCCCSSFSCFFMAVYRCTSSHSRHDAHLLSEWVASAFRLVLFGSEENRKLCLFGIIPVTSDRTLWAK